MPDGSCQDGGSGQTNRQDLERPANLKQLIHALARQLSDRDPAIGLEGQETVGSQALKGFPDRRPRYTEALSEFAFRQALTWRQIA